MNADPALVVNALDAVYKALDRRAPSPAFGQHLLAFEASALDIAQEQADATHDAVGVWERDGWFTVCDISPDLISPDPTSHGWKLWAVVEPSALGED
jgi:hypothetical protein